MSGESRGGSQPTEQLAAKKFDLMMDINVRGTFLLTKACLPHLRKSPDSHVLTLAPPMNLRDNAHAVENASVPKSSVLGATVIHGVAAA